MNKDEAKKLLEAVKKTSPKRNFQQSYDLIINLKELDMKKADQQVDFYAQLHNGIGKKITICALVGPTLGNASKDANHTAFS